MITLNTRLIKDGNSTSLRLPKTLLSISGLHDEVQLEVKKGQITIKKHKNLRAGWKEQIEQEIKANGPLSYVDDYGNLLAENENTIGDALGKW